MKPRKRKRATVSRGALTGKSDQTLVDKGNVLKLGAWLNLALPLLDLAERGDKRGLVMLRNHVKGILHQIEEEAL
jgi:hypothetical protein